MPTTWTIAIDWERNGSYTGAYGDVTDRMISASWFLGMRRPYQDIADDSKLTLKLSNHDHRFSPEYSAGPLYGDLVPFRPVRIQSNDGTTTRMHWIGWIESITPAVNQNGDRQHRARSARPCSGAHASFTGGRRQYSLQQLHTTLVARPAR
ncbi:MAG: hypothetical protein JXB47_08445 [Anaerolineae bacterium]|nr:hypothetical protein [Anaerolineae bacterium]